MFVARFHKGSNKAQSEGQGHMHFIDNGGITEAPTLPSLPSGRAPALQLFLTEPLRGAISFASLPFAAPLLARAPRGDGHSVLILPGLLGDDLSTRPLRRFLRHLGYDVHGWGLGRNVGPTPSVVMGLPRLLNDLSERSGRNVSVIGWSLGGIFAREVARGHHEKVRQVITLASPFSMLDTQQSRADIAFRSQSRHHALDGLPSRAEMREPIPVPSTAVFSRADGIVDWQSCIERSSDNHENIEVRASHFGIGVDPAVMWLLADRLSHPEGLWKPFKPPARFRALFPESSSVHDP